MRENSWQKLNPLQVGRYAEQLVKMELTLHELDVYTSEIDDRGIDFVIRLGEGSYVDVQVKAVRGFNYVFMRKRHFKLRPNLFLALVLLHEGSAPQLFLIPAEAWRNCNGLFVSRDYVGKKSEEEWGLNLSRRNLPLLRPYEFHESAPRFLGYRVDHTQEANGDTQEGEKARKDRG